MKNLTSTLYLKILLPILSISLVPQQLQADEYKNHFIYRCPLYSIVYNSPKINGEQFRIDLINGEVTGSEELYEKTFPLITKMLSKADDPNNQNWELQKKILLLGAQRGPELWINKKNGRGILFIAGGINYKGGLKDKINLGIPQFQSGGRQYRAKMRKRMKGSSVKVHITEDGNINATMVGPWGALVGKGTCTELLNEPKPTPRGNPPSDLAGKLRMLKKAVEQGLITNEEAAAKRKSILDKM